MRKSILIIALLGLSAPSVARGAGSAPDAVTDMAGPVSAAGFWSAGEQSRTGFRAPLSGPVVITRPFRRPATRYSAGHRGVDLSGSPGAQVLAAADGTVVFAGPLAGRGVVSIRHADGIRTTYEPVAATVTAGAWIGSGEPIGTLSSGHPGCPVAACLHWGAILTDGTYLDPITLLRGLKVRLKPWPPTS